MRGLDKNRRGMALLLAFAMFFSYIGAASPAVVSGEEAETVQEALTEPGASSEGTAASQRGALPEGTTASGLGDLSEGPAAQGQVVVPEGSAAQDQGVLPEGTTEQGQVVVSEGSAESGQVVLPEGFAESGQGVVSEETTASGQVVLPEGTTEQGQGVLPEGSADLQQGALPEGTAEPQQGTDAGQIAGEAAAQDGTADTEITAEPYPDLAVLDEAGENAVNFVFPDADTAAVEEILGYEVKAAHAPAVRLFSRAVSNSQYRFDGYYVLYKNNLATTKTDTQQDLVGNADKEKQYVKYQLDFHNDTDYAAGEVVIRVPYALYLDRYGEQVLPSDIAIPEAPGVSESSSFNYTIDRGTENDPLDDQLVITNCKDIGAGSNNMMQIFYALDDMATVDGTVWSIQPQIEVRGTDGGADVVLTGSMDTKTILDSLDKQAYTETGRLIYPELYTKNQVANALRGSAPIPEAIAANFDKYRYMLFRTTISGQASQPWNLTVTDTPKNDGIVLGQYITDKSTFLQGTVDAKTAGGTLTQTDQASYSLDTRSQSKTVYIWSVVAYPIQNGVIGSNNSVSNSISATLTGVDDGIPHTLSDKVSQTWEAYEWIYKGDAIGVQKHYNNENEGTFTEPSWLTAYNEYASRGEDMPLPHDWNVHGILIGYDLICPRIIKNGVLTNERVDNSATDTFTLNTVDDIQYARTNTGTYQELDYRDYYYTEVKITVQDLGIDIYEDTTTAMQDGLDTTVWVMTADQPGEWQQVAVVSYADAQRGYSLPAEWMTRGVYRIKAQHSSNDYETDCFIHGNTALRANSRVIQPLIKGEDVTSLFIENLGGVYGTATCKNNNKEWIQDESTLQYDQYAGLLEETKDLYKTDGMPDNVLMRDNATVELTALNGTNSIEKTGKGVNDPLHSQVDLTYTITAHDGYRIYKGTDVVNELTAAGISPSRSVAEIYDLLPLGVSFDPSVTVQAGRYTSKSGNERNEVKSWDKDDMSVSVDITDNYNDSGRQMVTFHLSYSGAENAVKLNDEKYYDWAATWGVQFGAYYAWKDIASCNGAENTAALQTDTPMKGDAYTDDGTGAPISTDGLLSDLDGDGDTAEKNVIYATAAVSLENAVAAASEIKKRVKEDADIYGKPVVDAGGVECGKTYTYSTNLVNGNNRAENLVLFDRLEYAGHDRPENDKHTFEENWWYGTFVSTNVDALTDAGIRAVVYYNTKRDAVIQAAGRTGSQVLADPANGWIKAENWTAGGHTAADVKAIAYDLTKKTDGTPYVLNENEALPIFTIRMLAPDALQNNAGGGNTNAADPGKPATYAYNNPAYYAKLTSGGSSTADTVIGNSTSIPLYDKTSLSVQKAPLLGEGAPADQAFHFTVTVAGVLYAYRPYKLYEANENGDWQEVPGLYTTDRNGILTLKQNQKALFNMVPGGQTYSIRENIDQNISWTSSAENAIGTLAANEENAAVFENTYHPLTYFEKVIKNPPKYVSLDGDTFTFRLLTGGEVAAHVPYYLVDASVAIKKLPVILKGDGKTGGTREDVQYTDGNGQFTIAAGQRVCFPQNDGEAYRFEEVSIQAEEDKYVMLGDGTAEGNAASPATLAQVTNKYNYKTLCLTKTVQDLDGKTVPCDESFKFVVKINGETYNGDYTLYSDSDDEKGQQLTMSDGVVYIKAGERVEIEALKPGADYEIHEILTDAQQEIYRNNGDKKGNLPIYADAATANVQNTDTRTALQLEKMVFASVTDMPAAKGTAFTFTVYLDKNGDGTAAADEAYAGKVYTLTLADGTTQQGTTTAAGKLTLKHGEKAYFADVPTGTAYRVVEDAMSGYVQIPAGGICEGAVRDDTAATKASFANTKLNNTLSIGKSVIAGEGLPEEELQSILGSETAKKNYADGNKLNPLAVCFRVLVDKNGGEDPKTPYVGGYVVNNRLSTGGVEVYAKTWTSKVDETDNSTLLKQSDDYPCKGIIPLFPGETAVLTGLEEGWTYRVEECAREPVDLPDREDDLYYSQYRVENEEGKISGNKEASFVNALSTTENKKYTIRKNVIGYKVSHTEYINVVGTEPGDGGGWDDGETEPGITLPPENGVNASSDGITTFADTSSDTETPVDLTKVDFIFKASHYSIINGMTYEYMGNDENNLDKALVNKMDGKSITYQVLENDGNGGWIPAVHVPWYDQSQLTDLGTYPNIAAGYTDEQGKVKLTMTNRTTGQDPDDFSRIGYFHFPAFTLESDGPLTGYRHTENGDIQCRYKVVEVQEETSEGFGSFVGMDENNIYNKIGRTPASFTVSKQVEGDEVPADARFTFTLTRMDMLSGNTPMMSTQEPVADQLYTLWDDRGTPEDPLDDVQIKGDISYTTDTHGQFTLAAGQYAKFEGMDAVQAETAGGNTYLGTVYRVDETPQNRWHAEVETTGDAFAPAESAYAEYRQSEGTGWIYGGVTEKLDYTNTYRPRSEIKVSKEIIFDHTALTAEQIAKLRTQAFTFALTVENKDYAHEEYHLYNRYTGEEIPNIQVINGYSVTKPWTTDEYGEFKLTSGQYAVFSYMGAGKTYEIEEMPEEGWMQVEPASGVHISGTTTTEGTSETFVNSYNTDSGSITVHKALSLPSGLAVPDDESYTFLLRVEGVPYAGQAFETYRSDGTFVSDDRMTDAYGRFTLQAGQYAGFTGVKSDVDYEVSEQVKGADGLWHTMGSDDAPETAYWLAAAENTEGATDDSGVTASFTNAKAAFLVGKNVTSKNGEVIPEGDEFTFTLTLDGAAAAAQPYWIYDKNGEKTGEGATDENGGFTLTAAQRALFYGIQPGTGYNIKESFKQDYTQTAPASTDGYSGTVGNTAPTLTFENDYAKSHSLNITKKVTGQDVPADAVFTFLVQTGSDDGKGNITYTPYANQLYYVGAKAYRTDAAGKLKISAGQTAVIRSLRASVRYKVEETDIPTGFSQISFADTGALGEDGGGKIGSNGQTVTVTNKYEAVIHIDLPQAGSPIWWGYLTGFALIIILSFAYRRRLRKQI